MKHHERTIACELEYDGAYGSCVLLAGEVADELDDIKCIMCDSLGMSNEEENAIKLKLGVTNHSFAVIAENVNCGPNDENYHVVADALSSAIQERLYEMFGVKYNVDNQTVDKFACGFSDIFKFENKAASRISLSKHEKEIISKFHPIQDCAKALGIITAEHVTPIVREWHDDATLNQAATKGFKKALLSPKNITPYTPEDVHSVEDIKWNNPMTQDALIMDIYFTNGTMLHEFEVPIPSVPDGGTPTPPSGGAIPVYSERPEYEPEPDLEEIEELARLERLRRLAAQQSSLSQEPPESPEPPDFPPFPGRGYGPELDF